MTRQPRARRPVLLRMSDKIDRHGPILVPELGRCWNWIGAKNEKGYGKVRDDVGRLVYAHRVALAIYLGRPLRPGMFANHRCDNKGCVRPVHLYEGTQSENERDKAYWGPVIPPKGDVIATLGLFARREEVVEEAS